MHSPYAVPNISGTTIPEEIPTATTKSNSVLTMFLTAGLLSLVLVAFIVLIFGVIGILFIYKR